MVLTDREGIEMASDEEVKVLAATNHNLIVAMQAAYIEWRHGGGAEAAMNWIGNTLDGPGLIPDGDEPYSTEAQAYWDANNAYQMPR